MKDFYKSEAFWTAVVMALLAIVAVILALVTEYRLMPVLIVLLTGLIDGFIAGWYFAKKYKNYV